MTPAGMAAMRRAATLVHALPGVRVRLRVGDRLLLEVTRPPLPEGPAIGPCVFRAAVARAHEQHKAGVRLGFVGLPEGCDPEVDVGVPAGGGALPGGIYRVPIGGAWVHAFATTLPVRVCRDVVVRHVGEDTDVDVRLHRDAATEVTLVHLVSARGQAQRQEQLEGLVAAVAVDELLDEVARLAS